MHVYYFAIAGGQLVTDEIGLNQAVGEAAGWITEKTMLGAIGFVPLASHFTQIRLGEVACVGE